MQCPKCNQPLVVVERNEVELDWCPECEGFWLDTNEIEILKHKLGITYNVLDPLNADIVKSNEKMLKCPKCGSYMGKVEVNGITIDKCMKMHGLWFDKSELSDYFNKFSTASPENADAINFFGEIFNRK